MKIKLSDELTQQIRNTKSCKTKEVVKYILENVEHTSTIKPIENTALKDISFNGKYAKAGEIDTQEGILYLDF